MKMKCTFVVKLLDSPLQHRMWSLASYPNKSVLNGTVDLNTLLLKI